MGYEIRSFAARDEVTVGTWINPTVGLCATGSGTQYGVYRFEINGRPTVIDRIGFSGGACSNMAGGGDLGNLPVEARNVDVYNGGTQYRFTEPGTYTLHTRVEPPGGGADLAAETKTLRVVAEATESTDVGLPDGSAGLPSDKPVQNPNSQTNNESDRAEVPAAAVGGLALLAALAYYGTKDR